MSIVQISREFSPAEAATITGVSPTLQRDWRRRGILESDPSSEGKWTRWSLTDIIRLAVMKLFADAGMEVSGTRTIASMALMPTLGALGQVKDAVEFVGEFDGAEKKRILSGIVRTTHPGHTPGRFLAAFGRGEHDVCRTDTLAALEKVLDREGVPVLSIVDCSILARIIVERAGGPVLRYEVAE